MGKRKEFPQAVVFTPGLFESCKNGKRRRGTADEVALTLLCLKTSREIGGFMKPRKGNHADDEETVSKARQAKQVVDPYVTDDEDETVRVPQQRRYGVNTRTVRKTAEPKRPIVRGESPPVKMALMGPPMLAMFHPTTGVPMKRWPLGADLAPIANLPKGRPLPPAPKLPRFIIKKRVR